MEKAGPRPSNDPCLVVDDEAANIAVLSMPVSLSIVRKHDGKIDVHGIVGQGTTFRVRLPRGV